MKSNIPFDGYVAFHAGCNGCTQQSDTGGYDICTKCQYFDPDWTKPNLNNQPLSERNEFRAKIMHSKTRGMTLEQWQKYYLAQQLGDYDSPRPSGGFIRGIKEVIG